MGTFTIESRLLVDYKGGTHWSFSCSLQAYKYSQDLPRDAPRFFGTDDDIAPIKKDTNGHFDSDSDSEKQKNEQRRDSGRIKIFSVAGAAAKHRGRILTPHPVVMGSILGISKNFSLDVAEIYLRYCLELWTEVSWCQSHPSRTGLWQDSN